MKFFLNNYIFNVTQETAHLEKYSMSCVVAGKIYKDDEKLRTFDPASKLTNENIIVTITSVI